MRVLTLLFAVYFLVLGGLPCTDAEAGAEQANTAVARARHRDFGTSSGTIDWCSPLCQCHCCAGFALTAVPALAFAAQPIGAYSAPRFGVRPTLAVPSRTAAAPWQPPQRA